MFEAARLLRLFARAGRPLGGTAVPSRVTGEQGDYSVLPLARSSSLRQPCDMPGSLRANTLVRMAISGLDA